jgi:hypothetical protein
LGDRSGVQSQRITKVGGTPKPARKSEAQLAARSGKYDGKSLCFSRSAKSSFSASYQYMFICPAGLPAFSQRR